MAKAFVFLADGFEDVEALIPIDVLRRGGVEVTTVSVVDESSIVTSAHGVQVVADCIYGDDISDDDLQGADLVLLPGGMPGAKNLYDHDGVGQAVLQQHKAGRWLAAICAAPAVVLGQLGVLRGRKATCYPGFEQLLNGATYTGDLCTQDGHIITAEGPAAAFPFAYKLLALLTNEQTAQQVAEGMRFVHLMQG
ncbi:MAG: DJ-1/PfpI family protein [Prevotella sp.]|nr:DJ-1/PfpI family protein [Prevotella sp.]